MCVNYWAHLDVSLKSNDFIAVIGSIGGVFSLLLGASFRFITFPSQVPAPRSIEHFLFVLQNRDADSHTPLFVCIIMSFEYILLCCLW